MSLEELKNDWDSIGKSTNQNEMSNEQIKAILKSKFRSSITKMLILDILILLIYMYFILLTIFRFDELEKTYLEILAILSIAMLVGLFIIKSIKLKDTYSNRFLKNSHSTSLKNLAKQNISIQRFYLINIVVGFFLIVILIILNIKIYNEYDLIQSKNFWLIITPSSFIFIVLINQWIKKYYAKVIRESKELLQELEN